MRFSILISTGFAASSLAGCQTINDVAKSVTGPESARDAQVDASVPGAAAAPSAPNMAAAGTAKLSGGLSGMTADGLRAAWGEPVLRRNETDSELWQYGGAGCALLVYLYPGAGNAMTVSHAEAVPGGTDEAAIAACAKAAGKPPLKPIS